MKLYKMILGLFFIAATISVGTLAIMVVMSIASVDAAIANGSRLLTVFAVLALTSAATAVVVRSITRLTK